jgi:hypothetical protein
MKFQKPPTNIKSQNNPKLSTLNNSLLNAMEMTSLTTRRR